MGIGVWQNEFMGIGVWQNEFMGIGVWQNEMMGTGLYLIDQPVEQPGYITSPVVQCNSVLR